MPGISLRRVVLLILLISASVPCPSPRAPAQEGASFRHLIAQGDRFHATGNLRAASASFASAIEAARTDDERAEALLKHAQVLRSLNRADAAEQELRQVVALNTASPFRRAAMFQLAGLLQQAGRRSEAVALYTDLADRANDQPALAADALLAAARLLLDANSYARARDVLARFPQAGIQPGQKVEAATLLVEALLGLGDLEGAQKAVAAQGLPASQAAYLEARLAQALVAKGRAEEALQVCQAALDADPQNQSVWRIRYQIAVRQGKAPELEQQVAAQLEADSTSDVLLQRLASMADWADDQARAVAIYGRIVKLRPDDPSLLERAGGLAADAGQLDEALGYFESALQLQPGETSLYYEIGEVQAKRGKLPEAVEAWKKGLAYRPGDLEAAARLGHLLAEHSLYEDAVRLYTECRETAGDPSALAAEMAAALAALGRSREAIEEYVTAASGDLRQAQPLVTEALKVARDASLTSDLVALAKKRLEAKPAPGLALLLALAEAGEGRIQEAIDLATRAGLQADDLLTIGESLEFGGDRDSAARVYAAVASQKQLSIGLRLENALRAADIDAAGGRLNEAADLLRHVTATPGGPPQLRDQASLLLADLTLQTGGDAEEAGRIFAALASDSALPEVARQARGRLADCAFAAGHFDEAAALYQQLANEAPVPQAPSPPPPPLTRSGPLIMSRVRVGQPTFEDPRLTPAYAASQIAECAFRSGQLDRAKTLFAEVAEKCPGSVYANDALERRLFIASHFAQPRPEGQAYLQALAQGSGPTWESAVANLRKLAALGSQEPLADDAAHLIAVLLEGHGRLAEAAEQFRTVARDFPQSLLAPEALLDAARLAESLGADEQAKEDLRAILQNFPSGPMAQTAALRLEDLSRKAK